MLRKLLSLANNAVGQRVGVLGLLTGPASLCAVCPGGGGFGLGLHAPNESADVNFFSTVGAVHAPENKPNCCLCEPQIKVSHYRTS